MICTRCRATAKRINMRNRDHHTQTNRARPSCVQVVASTALLQVPAREAMESSQTRRVGRLPDLGVRCCQALAYGAAVMGAPTGNAQWARHSLTYGGAPHSVPGASMVVVGARNAVQ